MVCLVHNGLSMRMRVVAVIVILVIVGAALVAGFYLNELFQFRKGLIAVLKPYDGNSYMDVELFPNTKLLRGVFLGFEVGVEKIGNFETTNKAVFAGIDKKSNLFFYRTPLALKVAENSFYRPAQFWGSAQGDEYQVVVSDWNMLKPGMTYSFMISGDVDKYFVQYDGGNINFFESKSLEKVFEMTKEYTKIYMKDLEIIMNGIVTPWKVYDVIEMSKGQPDGEIVISVPKIISFWYQRNLPNVKNN